MTISPAQLHLYLHDARHSTEHYGKSGAVRPQNGPMQGGMPIGTAEASTVTSATAIQALSPIARGLDTGTLLPARQDSGEGGAMSGADRSRAYAEAARQVSDNGHLAAAVHHSEADYSLNP